MKNSRAFVPEIKTFRRVGYFASLSDTELRELLRCCTSRRLGSGETLFEEGQSCSGLFIVAEGAVEVRQVSPRGREQVFHTEGPGATLGEGPLFDRGGFIATAVAIEPSRRRPGVALAILEVLARRLRGFAEIVTDLAFRPVTERLAGTSRRPQVCTRSAPARSCRSRSPTRSSRRRARSSPDGQGRGSRRDRALARLEASGVIGRERGPRVRARCRASTRRGSDPSHQHATAELPTLGLVTVARESLWRALAITLGVAPAAALAVHVVFARPTAHHGTGAPGLSGQDAFGAIAEVWRSWTRLRRRTGSRSTWSGFASTSST
jgi:CRP-like cAMP-binding protein